jgi:hypothetical protein
MTEEISETTDLFEIIRIILGSLARWLNDYSNYYPNYYPIYFPNYFS